MYLRQTVFMTDLIVTQRFCKFCARNNKNKKNKDPRNFFENDSIGKCKKHVGESKAQLEIISIKHIMPCYNSQQRTINC